MSGFNRKIISLKTGKKVASYCQEGASVEDRYAMIRHFLLNEGTHVHSVIYEVNPLIFSEQVTAENVYTRFYPYMDEWSIDQYISKNAPPWDYLIHKFIRTSRFDSRLLISITKGYLGRYDDVKLNSLKENEIKSLVVRRNTLPVILNKKLMTTFENTISLISNNSANTIIVMMPMYYVKKQSFDRIGYKKLSLYFENFCQNKANVKYIDLNRSKMTYSVSYFTDPLHFNVYGQTKLSEIISSLILEN